MFSLAHDDAPKAATRAHKTGGPGANVRTLARLASVALVAYLGVFVFADISPEYFEASDPLELARRIAPLAGAAGLVLALVSGRLGGLIALAGGLGYFAAMMAQGLTPLAGPIDHTAAIHGVWVLGLLHLAGSFLGPRRGRKALKD